jgi:hypothetical protein
MELSRKTVGKYTRFLYPTKNLKEKGKTQVIISEI